MEVQFILEILLVPASNSDIEESDFLKLNLIFHLGEMIYCVILQRRDDVEYLLSFGFYELYLLVFVVRVSARGCDIFQMTVHIKYNVRPKKKIKIKTTNKPKRTLLFFNFCIRQWAVFERVFSRWRWWLWWW